MVVDDSQVHDKRLHFNLSHHVPPNRRELYLKSIEVASAKLHASEPPETETLLSYPESRRLSMPLTYPSYCLAACITHISVSSNKTTMAVHSSGFVLVRDIHHIANPNKASWRNVKQLKIVQLEAISHTAAHLISER